MQSRRFIQWMPVLLVACAGPQHAAPPVDAPKSEQTESQSANTPRLSASEAALAAESSPMKDTKSAEAQSYERECKTAIEASRQAFLQLEQYKGPTTVDAVLDPLNELWMQIDRGNNKAGLYRNVHPDKGMRDVADHCEKEFSKIITDIGLSNAIYANVSKIDTAKSDESTKRYVKIVLRDFRRAGVDKTPEVRDQIRKLKDDLVSIGQAFGQNIRDDVRAIKLQSKDELAGLPDDYIEAHKPAADGTVTISTDTPDYLPYMTYAKSDNRRLELYKVYRQRGYPANEKVLADLLRTRHELAVLLGYKNWAHYITEDKMIKTEQAARTFIDKINTLSKKRAQRDYDELLARLRKDDPKAAAVGDWQRGYLEEIVRREKYDFDSQAVRQYFAYGKVRQGLLDVTSDMFDVSYRKADVPVWHPSVEAFEILDKDGTLIGRFYLDMHPREGKYKHAAAFQIVTGVEGRQVPEAVLVCNFPGEGNANALMEHDQVETFYHEFGHLLHHLFAGKHRWIGVSGFNTEWDFVEAPSQMLEEWAWEPKVLKRFATNEKGDVIPDALINKMKSSRDFGKGLWVRHQMFYAALSLRYYNQDPSKVDPTELMKQLQAEYSPFGYVDDTYFHYSFGHLDGYSAIYYTYMWSLVIAKDLFDVFEHKGLLDKPSAARYRKYVLEPGGSKDAAVLVRDFLGRDYTFDAFSRWLNQAN